ncbi:MAG TPA: sulfotransferase [Anaerolineales bacterium]|nr:sulfotransferase [Anaerolineales bacterium]
MAIDVLGAGFGRTGTKSLKTALEIIGFGPCYHMTEVKENPGHREAWNAIAFGRAEPDWDALFDGYRAAVDWPATHYWRELAAHCPQAKVILTIRDPEDWHRSYINTISHVVHQPVPPEAPEDAHLHRDTIRKIIVEDTFQGRDRDPVYAVGAYLARLEQVARTIDLDRLLVYDITTGWKPLCDFLGVPIPPEPFPHKNTTEEFLSQDLQKK